MGRQRFEPCISHIQTYFVTPIPSRSVYGYKPSGSANSALVGFGRCHVSSGFTKRRASFSATSVRMGFLVHATQLVQVFHLAVPFILIIIIPSMPHTHISFIYHLRHTNSPCCRPVCFTSFWFNAPCQITPHLNLCSLIPPNILFMMWISFVIYTLFYLRPFCN